MLRPIFASGEMATRMKLAKQPRVDIFSFFPIDRGDCECAKMISEWKDKMIFMTRLQKDREIERLGHLTCPRDKTGMRRYKITCKNCGEVQGYCYASDRSLKDFCDFHYIQWCDGEQWHGCFTPNISPITQQLTLECTCGQDTRDFRANQTLSGKRAWEMEMQNRIGREFNEPDSKFKVTLAT